MKVIQNAKSGAHNPTTEQTKDLLAEECGVLWYSRLFTNM